MKSTPHLFPQKLAARHLGSGVILAIALCVASGCASNAGVKITDGSTPVAAKNTNAAPRVEVSTSLQDRAMARSKERWALLLAGKFEDTYAYLTAASQKGMTAADYGRRMATLRFRSANVVSATCEDDACVVTVNVRIGQVVPRVGEVPHELPMQERWVQVDGTLGLIRR
jgi:hypothetical protein